MTADATLPPPGPATHAERTGAGLRRIDARVPDGDALTAHRDIADEVVERLSAEYRKLPVGDPFEDGTLVGPLISVRAAEAMRVSHVNVDPFGEVTHR